MNARAIQPRRPAAWDDVFAIAASGARINLASPDATLVRVADIADGLSQLNRWAGATIPAPFSVAQHSSIVADEMYRIGGPLAGLYGLLHDGHEYLLGDAVHPFELALAVLWRDARTAIEVLKGRLDVAIHARFGLAWPPPPAIAKDLAAVHERAVLTEMRDITRGHEPEIAELEARGVTRLPNFIRPRTAPLAREGYLARFDAFGSALGLKRTDQGGLL